MNIKDSSFLITGGAGFVGSNIVEYLVLNKAKLVRVLDNLSTGFKANIEEFSKLPNFEFVEGDIANYDICKKAVKGIDFVNHQAALGSIPRSIENPMKTSESNVSGFINMAFAAKEEGIKKFVYASSSSVFGDETTLPKVEDKIGNQLSPYAITKYTNELYSKVFSQLYSLNMIGLRYFNIFGPKQSPKGPYAAAIPIFIDALQNNKPITVHGDGEQSRDFTYVTNAVSANMLALQTKSSLGGEVFNIAVGQAFTINKVVALLEEITNKKATINHVEGRKGDIKHSLADISKAHNLLGYEPLVSFKNGLKQTYQHFATKPK